MEDLTERNRVATFCGNSGCPSIYEPDGDSILVQGYSVDAGASVPAGESVVRVPLSLLRDAARALQL